MNRSEFVSGISAIWRIANELGLAEVYANPSPLPVDEKFRDLVLSGEATYIDVYSLGLSQSHYNILLSDYSYFQLSLEAEENVRYAYYPNPYKAENDSYGQWFESRRDMVDAGMLTHEEFLSLLSTKTGVGNIPLLRYENAPQQRKMFQHPCSHFHIGFHSDNRWAVRRVLTPLAFALLVFKMYYGQQWRTIGDDEHDEVNNLFERHLIGEKAKCYMVADVYFDPIEERAFFFG
jgi:hypothetical protein